MAPGNKESEALTRPALKNLLGIHRERLESVSKFGVATTGRFGTT
jgi:hypothetical protein